MVAWLMDGIYSMPCMYMRMGLFRSILVQNWLNSTLKLLVARALDVAVVTGISIVSSSFVVSDTFCAWTFSANESDAAIERLLGRPFP